MRKSLIKKSFKWMRGNGLSEKDFFDKLAAEDKKTREYHAQKQAEYRRKDPERSRASLHRSYWKHVAKRRLDARLQRENIKADPIKHAAYVERVRISKKKRADNDPIYRVRRALRGRVWMALHRHKGTKKCKTMQLIGCSLAQFREYIESRWLPGMSWENYGRRGWHIDHRTPIASFDLTKEKEQRLCFHYTNLQPLWWADNLSKGAKTMKQMDLLL